MKAASDEFELHRNIIRLHWSWRDDLDGKKKGHVGRKRKYVLADVKSTLEAVPKHLRQTVRGSAESVGISNSSFAGLMDSDEISAEQEAKRNSKNRPKGAAIAVPVTIDRPRARAMLIDHIIPAIKRVWPGRGKRIFIQQDNASPRCLLNDAAVIEAGAQDGWDISLTVQPPNSPGLNDLDLGYFASIQALQQTKQTSSIDDLIRAVQLSYAELDRTKLDNVFIKLMSVMEQYLWNAGGNQYSIPHIRKDQRRRKGDNLVSLECCSDAFAIGILAKHLELLEEVLQ